MFRDLYQANFTAEAFGDMLTGGTNRWAAPKNVHRLVNGRATKAAIGKALEEIVSRAATQDRKDRTPLAEALGPAVAGQPALAAVGALLFVLGVVLAARPTEPTGTFAHREAAFAVAVAAAWAFAAAAVLGVARHWSYPTLAGLCAGGVSF